MSPAFQLLERGRAPAGYALHNVRLVDVEVDEADRDVMVVERDAETTKLRSSAKSGADLERHIGLIGSVAVAPPWDADGCVFTPYVDQSLRRAPELDAPDHSAQGSGHHPSVLGWRSGARPDGFWAPVGMVPGMGGVRQ